VEKACQVHHSFLSTPQLPKQAYLLQRIIINRHDIWLERDNIRGQNVSGPENSIRNSVLVPSSVLETNIEDEPNKVHISHCRLLQLVAGAKQTTQLAQNRVLTLVRDHIIEFWYIFVMLKNSPHTWCRGKGVSGTPCIYLKPKPPKKAYLFQRIIINRHYIWIGRDDIKGQICMRPISVFEPRFWFRVPF